MRQGLQSDRGAAGRRLRWSAVAAGALVVSALALPSYAGGGVGALVTQEDPGSEAATQPPTHVHAAGSEPHTHNDPATKNAISRSGETGENVRDPSTLRSRTAAAAYIAGERRAKDPQLTTVRPTPKRAKFPRSRYAMANGCYRLAGKRLFFKPTDLGQYLLYTRKRSLLTATGRSPEPSDAAVWTASAIRGKAGTRRFTFTNGSTKLTVRGRTAFRLLRASGCVPYPEAGIDISGRPHAGVTTYQEVRGYVDAHTHGMAFEFLGGEAHCGRPWHRFGAPYALVDCPDHTATGGYGGVLESFLSKEPHHDPVGWPTFKDWPAPNSLTHEGTYYRWLERSWRGGQRLFVNLLVENNILCEIYPYKRNSCDDMDSVRLQARDMYEMQDYIDAQMGGPGKGFYRIVKNPFQARKVINAGKMAVVMGIETSVPFGCTFKRQPGSGDVPACDAADIDRQIAEVHKMGVRQMELVNKFDNALSGVAGDEGDTGVAVNSANFLETGTYWDMRHCEPADGESHDRNQHAAPDISAGQQDALFGAVAELFGAGGLTSVPAYGPPDHCNERGLTTLGEHTIKVLAKKHMLFDPDHMSVKARNSALDQIEAMKYPGVLSSHSWSTPDAYPRIYRAGGFIAPYAGDSTGFVDKWRRHLGWADPRYYFGIGFGADMNGLGAQGDPRGAGVPNKVSYPFRGINGISVNRQTAGQRVWDINVDGVAQYGLYPDWVEDLRQVAGKDGDASVEDMARGAEASLQTWERAHGIKPDSCRNPGLRKSVSRVERLIHRGMGTKAVMRAVGQPYTRLGRIFGFCAKAPSEAKVRMVVKFNRAGRVLSLRERG